MELEDDELEFKPILDLLIEDTEDTKKLKSIYQKEREYSDILGPLEWFVANFYYYDNPNLKDSDVEIFINKVKRNLDENLDFFEGKFEKGFFEELSFALQESKKKRTKHELILVLNYILWAIDNRKYFGCHRAYLDWLCHYFKIFDIEEEKKFNEFYGVFDVMGFDEEMVKSLKGDLDSNFKLSKEDIKFSKRDSESFLEEEGFWEESSFIESMSSEEMEKKMKSFHMSHDQDVNYECKKCGCKISLHNKDWHNCLCDKCFGR